MLDAWQDPALFEALFPSPIKQHSDEIEIRTTPPSSPRLKDASAWSNNAKQLASFARVTKGVGSTSKKNDESDGWSLDLDLNPVCLDSDTNEDALITTRKKGKGKKVLLVSNETRRRR